MNDAGARPPASQAASDVTARRWRPWTAPAAIGVVASVVVIGVRIGFANDSATRFLATFSALMLAAIALAVWLLLFAGLPAKGRSVLIVGWLLTVGAVAVSFTVRHYSGDIVPVIGWRWLQPRALAGDNKASEWARGLEQRATAWAVAIGACGIAAAAFAAYERRSAVRTLTRLAALCFVAGNAGVVIMSGLASKRGVAAVAPAGGTADLRPIFAGDYPQFQGPKRDGRVTGVHLARDWNAHPPKRLWRQSIGEGWSAFAIVGDYAFTQERRDTGESAVCYRVKTGEIVWEHFDEGTFVHPLSGNGPRGTPTVAGGLIYAVSSMGLLNCLDGRTGDALWSHSLLQDHEAGLPQWGVSGSPLVLEDKVIVNPGGPAGHSLAAYDRTNGEPIWTGGDDRASYSSPLAATLGGKLQIVIVNGGSVAGHDPETGQVVWQYAWGGGEPKVPQPVPFGPNQLWIGAGYGLGCMLLEISPPAAEGGAWSVRDAWPEFNRQLKPKFTNVVAVEDLLFGIDDGKGLVCLRLPDGERLWRGGRYGHGQILSIDDLLLVVADHGEIALVHAVAEGHQEVARAEGITGQSWNPPAFAPPYLMLRNSEQATCLELPLDGG